MSARQVAQAEVMTQTGRRFRVDVTNLATTGLFLKSTEPFSFGQRLTLRLLDVSVRGEVLFVSGEPPGAVIGIRAAPTALATLEAYRDHFEVLSSTDDPWTESTVVGEPQTAEMPVRDILALVEEERAKTPVDRGIDPGLVAAASKDDAFWQGDDPITAADIPAFTGSTPTPPDGAHAAAQSSATPRAPPGPLPVLDADGRTVRFASPAAYQTQFDSHLSHGGLVVLAEPLPIGTHRMLSLAVPQVGTYTVRGRVIFHTAGRLGFMLDSFSHHRARLAEMAQTQS